MSYLCNRNRETNNVSRDAQMAESVDALVSNTSGAIHPGSIPGLGTEVGILKTELPLFLSNKHNIHSNMPENPLL